MKLLTKAILKRFEQVGRQEEVEDPIVICKFFNPTGADTWYATEYDSESRMFFGLADILEQELGYFSLDEFENTKLRFGLKIERDLYFKECRLSKVRK